MEKPSTIPYYVTGKTKDDLIKNMLRNNALNKKHFKYFGIQKDGNEWIAWYYAELDLNTARDIINGRFNKTINRG
jgi:hypothetical protein